MRFNKIVLFDIDYTLFNTDVYRQKLYPRLGSELGIPEDEFFLLARGVSKEVKETVGHYSPDLVLQKLLALSKSNTTLERLEEIFWDKILYEELLDKDTVGVLEKLQKEGIATGLLTTGDRRHQLAKVHTVLQYFPEENHHIFTNKLESILNVLKKYKSFQVYVVDDLPVVLAKAKGIDKNVITILRKTNKVYEKTVDVSGFNPDWTIDEITEVVRIVKK